MIKNSFIIFAGLFFIISSYNVSAQDVVGSSDHSLVSRMKDFYIAGYEHSYNEIQIPFPGEKLKPMEGQLTHIVYEVNEDKTPPIELQIIRNYTGALTRLGAKVVFDGEHGEFGAGRTASIEYHEGGKEVWVVVNAYAEGQAYSLWVLEIRNMQQDVKEGSMAEQLAKAGQVTVKINFDTGSSDIRPESSAVLQEITDMLKADPALKLRIEGHTDDQGQPWANLMLSIDRASSVARALHKKGIAAERLAVSGFGQTTPVADNTTEKGRAENRRVTLVRL